MCPSRARPKPRSRLSLFRSRRHQRLQRLARAAALEQHRAHLLGDRQLHAVLGGRGRAPRARCSRPPPPSPCSAEHLPPAARRGRVRSPDVPVPAVAAHRGRDQVAHRRSVRRTSRAARPAATPSRRDLGQSAREQRALGVVAEAEAVAHPGRDRDHVLERAPDSQPTTSVVRVDPEARRRDTAAAPPRARASAARRRHHRGRDAAAHLLGVTRTGEHRTRPIAERSPRAPRSCAARVRGCPARDPWWRRPSSVLEPVRAHARGPPPAPPATAPRTARARPRRAPPRVPAEP